MKKQLLINQVLFKSNKECQNNPTINMQQKTICNNFIVNGLHKKLLHELLINSFNKHSDRIALCCSSKNYSYNKLLMYALSISATLQNQIPKNTNIISFFSTRGVGSKQTLTAFF